MKKLSRDYSKTNEDEQLFKASISRTNNKNDDLFKVSIPPANNVKYFQFHKNKMFFKILTIICSLYFILSIFIITYLKISEDKRYTNRFIKDNFPNSLIKHFGDKRKESKKYIDLCVKGDLLDSNISNYELSNNPKVSIIITIHDREKYIKSIIRSIQNQPLKEIEMIFVDDASTDNSIEEIKNYQKEDKRIRLIKNEKNLGVLFTRIRGVEEAKGEYIFIMDGDDLLLEHGLNDAYEIAKLKNIDAVEFNHYEGRENYGFKKVGHEHNFNLVFGEQYKNFIFKNKQGQYLYHCYYLWRFLFKREIILKSIELLNKYFKNSTSMNYFEDTAQLYACLKYVNSYQFINVFGYYWNFNPDSDSHLKPNIKLNNLKIKCLILYMKFINEYFDDSIGGNIIKSQIFFRNSRFQSAIFYNFTEGFEEILKLCDMYNNEQKYEKRIVNYINFIKEIVNNTLNNLH